MTFKRLMCLYHGSWERKRISRTYCWRWITELGVNLGNSAQQLRLLTVGTRVILGTQKLESKTAKRLRDAQYAVIVPYLATEPKDLEGMPEDQILARDMEDLQGLADPQFLQRDTAAPPLLLRSLVMFLRVPAHFYNVFVEYRDAGPRFLWYDPFYGRYGVEWSAEQVALRVGQNLVSLAVCYT